MKIVSLELYDAVMAKLYPTSWDLRNVSSDEIMIVPSEQAIYGYKWSEVFTTLVRGQNES